MNDLLNTPRTRWNSICCDAWNGYPQDHRKREIYAKDLPFNEFPEWEINELTDNIANRAEAINILFRCCKSNFVCQSRKHQKYYLIR